MPSSVAQRTLVAMLLVCAVAGRAHAQATLSTTVTNFSIVTPTTAEYNAQSSTVVGLNFTVKNCKSSAGCPVTIAATNPTFGPNQPIAHLEWQLNGTTPGQWHPMSTSAAQVTVVPNIQGGQMSQSGTIYFHVLLSWTQDVADQLYSSGINLTISQP
jgi:hypothetical protein